MALKCINVFAKTFKEFPVCPQCKSVYNMHECIDVCGSIKKAKKCQKRVGRSQCDSEILITQRLLMERYSFALFKHFVIKVWRNC